MGTSFPPGCDLFVAAPGLAVRRYTYEKLCPGGNCDRYLDLDLFLAE
ncbi:hypothetical protein BH11MYX2_BH11MYX2_37260 [soil metagenome]